MNLNYCNQKSINFINLLMNKIQNSEINDSIDFAYYFGETLFHNQIPLFDISSLEEKLIEKTYSSISNSFSFNIENKGFLFVVTEPYITGGHTRLMENLALMLDQNKELIVTKDMKAEVKNRLNSFFPKIIECYRDISEDSVSYINKLINNFIKYDSIILNIHPQDVYSVIACGIAKRIKKSLKIYFVNHADHAFTYGITVADFWFEISLLGSKINNLRNIKSNRTFLGIAINKSDTDFFKNVKYTSLSHTANFMTAASPAKYKPFKNQSIFPLINKLLKSNKKFSLSVIGVDLIRNYWWWLIKLKFFSRLKLYKSLPYEKYIEITKKADCYIDSHPFPGGTAFVEQFLNGVPCVGLKSSFFGYTPLEKLKKDRVEEVICMLNNSPSDEEILDIQKLIFEVHGFSQVKSRFKNTLENGIIFNNPMIDNIENKELIFFTSKNINISVDFFKFLLKNDKLFCVKNLFIVSKLVIIKSIVKLLAFNLKNKLKNLNERRQLNGQK
ncbi:hypothetical protein AAX26_01347 [Aliarcobacter thereius]|uniref:hypothetical protein n=1 Tax=Aliarcobacter thereius TaxID=544718 RepID=UPI0008288C75|nr:hypothetical protein [Aliarcobacter thereius]OCL87039.1 hypothetical protein AAX26_01347 [Aliarcobacter thereius]